MADIRDAFVLKTDISKSFWCVPDIQKQFRFESATTPSIMGETREIAWLDMLFEGGIFLPKLPDGQNRAITILITGSPGSGKSILAMELCYRWTRNFQARSSGLNSLFITTETNKQWIMDKARSFGWQDVDRCFLGQDNPQDRPEVPRVTIWPSTDFSEYIRDDVELAASTKIVLKVIESFTKTKGLAATVEEFQKKKHDDRVKTKIAHIDPDILVIDSLNTAEPTLRPDLFNAFVQLSTAGPRIILIILDSNSPRGNSEFWEYMCDIAIRLDKVPVQNYMIRTIEILKARYQSHIWGVHQLKIYPKYVRKDGIDPLELRRAHPYRHEGGIFIFPSIHFYLSLYKRRSPKTEPESVVTELDGLKQLKHILRGGFPKGRCTGFIGFRGGHKSHLGYAHLLSRVVADENEKALIISLRDDEGTVRQTVSKILTEEFSRKHSLTSFERADRIEILYYPPGYITPEEFFHRMFMSISRLKNGGNAPHLTVLFNSLDQLSSRFPLCSKEEIFVPGIIETLSAEDITSIFIAVDEPGQPPEQYGLLSMAELILSFNPQTFLRDDYCGHLDECLKFSNRLVEHQIQSIKEKLGLKHRAVVLRVVRFAGGQSAGDGGILELVSEEFEAYELYGRKGLNFIPFSSKFSQETPHQSGGMHG